MLAYNWQGRPYKAPIWPCPLSTTPGQPAFLPPLSNLDSESHFVTGKVKSRVFQHFPSPNYKDILKASLFALQKEQLTQKTLGRALPLE